MLYADYAEIQFACFTQITQKSMFYAFLRNQVNYAVLWRGGNYPPSRVLRNDAYFFSICA